MTNLGLFFWQICQKHIPNREKGVQENPQAFLYPENKTIFSALHPYPLRGAGDGGKQRHKALFVHDPSRENGIAERPQTLRYPENKTNFSAVYAQSTAERIQNRPRYIRIRWAARAMEASSATRRFSSIWPQ